MVKLSMGKPKVSEAQPFTINMSIRYKALKLLIQCVMILF